MSKLIKVFYDNNGLPYKDKELTTHFPIVGSGFLGASNTTIIRFYYGALGTSDNVYSAVSKLPNGKTGNTILEKGSDSDGDYAELSLNYWYTQAKGDVYISLKVYRGGTTATWDEDSQTYIVEGSPIIESTGAIKLSINYAPIGDYADYNDEFTTYEEIKAALGGKLDIENGVYATSNIALEDMSLFEENQIFFDYTSKKIYKKVGNVAELIFETYSKSEIDTELGKKVDKLTTSGKYAYAHISGQQGEIQVSEDVINNAIPNRTNTGQLKVPTTPTDNAHATSKIYVDGFGKSLEMSIDSDYKLSISLKDNNGNVLGTTQVVDLPLESVVVGGTYDSVNKAIILTLQNGSSITIPVGDLVSDLVSTEDLQDTLENYVEKTTDVREIYCTDENGNTTSIPFEVGTAQGVSPYVIPQRDGNGDLLVPYAPHSANAATPKDYVDNGFASIKTLNGTSLLGGGDYAFDSTFNESSTNALENKVIAKEFRELNYELAIIREELFEVVLTELDYTEDFATLYAIPTSISDTDGTHRVVYSETQLKTLSGNSVVLNNLALIQSGYFGSSFFSGTATVDENNKATLTGSFTSSGNKVIGERISIISGRNYLRRIRVNGTISEDLKVSFAYYFPKTITAGTYTNQTYQDVLTASGSNSNYLAFENMTTTQVFTNFSIQIELIDLTQFDPFETSWTLDNPKVKWLLTQGYIPYNTGSLYSSVVSGLRVKNSNDNVIGTISVPQTTLPSAGTAHDYLEVVEGDIVEGEQLYNIIKHVVSGSLDLGEISGNWYVDSNNIAVIDVSALGFKTNNSYSVKENMNCERYIATDFNHLYSGTKKAIGFVNNALAIQDDDFAGLSSSQVKTLLSGIVLYYELDTQTQEPIATGLHFNEVSSLIEEGGSIEPIFTNVPPNSTTTFVVKKAVGE